jgi:beta-phosphoglucomutase
MVNLKAKAVIFDLDGVITDTMRYHFDAWFKVLKDFGIKVDCYDIYKREGQSGIEALRDILKERDIRLSPSQVKDILNKKEEFLKKTVKIRFIKGSRPFIRNLKRKGFSLALVTGTSGHEVKRILPEKIYSIFDCLVTADDCLKSKPDPYPFNKAVSLLKIPKKECIVIENAPYGVESAKRAGLFCVALETSLPRKFLKDADMIFKSVADLDSQVKFVYARD